MFKTIKTCYLNDIECTVIYSGRRTIGISILPDSTVIVRVPHLTSVKTINRLFQQKSEWIIKHRNNYNSRKLKNPEKLYVDGELHLFRGNNALLSVRHSKMSSIRFSENIIEMELSGNNNPASIKSLLYKGYKREAMIIFHEVFKNVLLKFNNQNFKPTALIIRTMKRRWGSCSSKGVITLSTELIKLSEIYLEYVIIHELCHLKHHNHSTGYYKLLSELYPEWKKVRNDLRRYVTG